MAQDPDYRENQTTAWKNWSSLHPEYWQEYRKRRPDYVERNCQRQRERNRARKPAGVIVKMDELPAHSRPFSRRFRLVPIEEGMMAKMDELILEIPATPGIPPFPLGVP